MTDTKEAAAQRDRSPAFPVVSLEAAIGKLTEFESHFKRTAARPEKIGDAWGIKTKAYVDRIAAALRYFGLLEYQGSGKERGIVISEEGRKYLRAHQEETKQEVVKAAALRPKQIAKFWNDWGPERPADAACMDLLIQKHGFSDSGAHDFLKVYDATITYAKLSDSDKADLTTEDEVEEEVGAGEINPPMASRNPPPPSPPPLQGKVRIMEGERVVFTEETDPANYVKLVASGAVDDSLLEALEDYVKRQRKRLVTAYQAGVAQMVASGKTPPRSIAGGAGKEDEEEAGAAGDFPWNKEADS